MKLNKHKILSAMLAVIFCMAAFALSVSADGYYSSDESGKTSPPAAIDSITITTEGVGIEVDSAATEIEDNEEVDLDSFFDDLFSVFGGTDALTPVGNMTLIDDIIQDESNTTVQSMENEQKSKQFITVQTKNGNYFYIIIDRSGDTENVYFLNLVDEADLFALLEDGEPVPEENEPAPICTCEEKCAVGEVNTDCEICAVKMKNCGGKEAVQTAPNPEPQQQKNNSGILLIVLFLAVGGGAAVYFLKFRKDKPKTAGTTDLDDYDYGEDVDEIEYESENEEDTIE
ncbi:MAG: DUF4366 domain-containing protein [Clostridia bacterium]|nr:DUF4366 domain-containing protein [Clostridia bacterium]MBQ8187072.1 DUF4366 domain-containing protein [Clostridia bacterium]